MTPEECRLLVAEVRRLADRVQTLEHELGRLREYVTGMDEALTHQVFGPPVPMLVAWTPEVRA